MNIVKKKVKGVLSLMSIQSTPLTVGALLFGYGSIEGAILTMDIIPLIVAGALSHWAFYGMNDVMDLEYDKKQGRSEKPLVSGLISPRTAITLIIMLCFYSLTIAMEYFEILAVVLFVVSFICGAAYNFTSKTSPYAAVWLGEWGAAIVLTGAAFAGDVNVYSTIFAMILGAHMLWMTFVGDLKDLDQDEASIPSLLNCSIKRRSEESYLFTTIPMNVILFLVITSEVALILAAPLLEVMRGGDVIVTVLTGFCAFLLVKSSDRVLSQKPFEPSRMKRDIALRELVTVLGIAVASLSFMGYQSVLVLGFAVLIWGTLIQTLLYGHPLRFP